MSDRVDDSTSRPAKRARLDDSANETAQFSTPSTTDAPARATANGEAAAPIDQDLERELRAGITQYVCPDNLGFTGVLKQRYTDFLVNEIGLDGKVVHLRSTETPRKKGADNAPVREEVVAEGKKNGEVEKEEDKQANGEEQPNKQAAGEKEDAKEEAEPELADEDRETLNSIFGETATQQIVTLVRQVRRREQKKAKDFKPVIAPKITDKEMRTQAHQSLRRIFPNLLESSMEEDQSIRIKAAPPADRKGKKGKGSRGDQEANRKRGQQMWEELGGEYLHFTLYKENKDTMEVVGFLGSKLNCGSKGFGFAGTKDRRACTAQRVCVKRTTAERMAAFNKMLFNAAVGDFEYRNNDLKLGDLNGNEFTITLRDCHFQNEEGMDHAQRMMLADQVLEKAVADFSERGFINYYGLQRFGSFAASTDAIGRKMLQMDLQGAVEDLLDYSETALAAAQNEAKDPTDANTPSNTLQVSQDDRNRALALHLWRTEQNGAEALNLLPRKFTAERNIIQHLSSRNSRSGQRDRLQDWQGALMTIPRTLRLMYVHAYQSLVWNIVAGKRWALHGEKVVEGDLVLVHEHVDKEEKKTVEVEQTQDQDGEVIINPTGSESAHAADAGFERARALTASEASSGKYTIFDIVLPQPGYDVEYPPNAIGDFYKDFMGSEKGGGLDPRDMRRSWREISLSGGYRKVLARPLEGMSAKAQGYADKQGEIPQFVTTDLERVRRQKQNGGKKESGDTEMADVEEGEEKEGSPEDDKIAVVLTMQLASSQYATMALRELMKAGGVRAYKPEFMGGR